MMYKSVTRLVPFPLKLSLKIKYLLKRNSPSVPLFPVPFYFDSKFQEPRFTKLQLDEKQNPKLKVNSPTGDLGRERKEGGRRREGNTCAHMPTAHVSELTEEEGKKRRQKGKITKNVSKWEELL